MAYNYQLLVKNSSPDTINICVYVVKNGLSSLAWFSKRAAAGVSENFKWNEEYSLDWSETGELVPGVLFGASQSHVVYQSDIKAGTNNCILLQRVDGDYSFGATSSAPVGQLGIDVDAAVENKEITIGVGLYENPCLVTQAVPSQHFRYSVTDLEYHLAIFPKDHEIEPGSVLDFTDALLNSPLSITSGKQLVVVYDGSATLSEKSLKEYNKKFIV